MPSVLLTIVLLAADPDSASHFDKIEKAIARFEREKQATSIRGFSGLLGAFKRSVVDVKRGFPGTKPTDKKAKVAKVGSLQISSQLIQRTLEQFKQKKLADEWLEVRREIDAIGKQIGVPPKVRDASAEALDDDTEELKQRVKRFQETLRASRNREVGKIGFTASAVAFHLGRLVPMARRGESKSKQMKAAWKKVWPELDKMVAASKRHLPRQLQREALEIAEAARELQKRYP